VGRGYIMHPNVCAAFAGSRPVLNLGPAYGIELAYITSVWKHCSQADYFSKSTHYFWDRIYTTLVILVMSGRNLSGAQSH